MRRFWMLLVALVALVIFMAIPTLAAENLTYCLCGDADGHIGTTINGCDGTVLTWKPWTSTNSLPTTEEGNWYLTDTVKLTTTVTFSTPNLKINIDLNGKTIESTNGKYRLMRFFKASTTNTGANITLRFVSTGGTAGTIKHYGASDQGTVFWLNTNSKLIMSNIIVDASGSRWRTKKEQSSSYAGDDANAPYNSMGGNSIDVVNGSFTMYGGEIRGGKSAYGGDALATDGGTAALYGTTISANTADDGSGIVIRASRNLTLSDCTVNGTIVVTPKNSSDTTVPTLTLAGQTAITKIELTKKTYDGTAFTSSTAMPTLSLSSDFTASTPIRLSANAGAFTNNGRTAANADCFTYDGEGFGVALNTNDNKLWVGITYCLCGSTSENAADHKHYMDGETLIGCDGNDLVWLPWTSGTALPTKTGNYYLTKNVSLSGQTSLIANSNVVLDLNGYKVTPAQTDGVDNSMRMISIHNSGAKFTLTDTYVVPENNTDESRPGGEIVTSTAKKDVGNGVWVRNDKFAIPTTFVMVGGKLTGADATNTSNGTVVNAGTSCKFYMLGGTITGGKTSGNGGNVYLSTDSSMVMTGGTISSGVAARGANVYTNNGCSFIMTGGTITGGNVSGNGGNLYIGGGTTGTLDISGSAIISEGTASGNGGNIFLNNNAEATMISGTVTGGNAKNGGNININTGATLTMEGGEVTDGTATTAFCSGVQAFGSLDVSGGKIEDSIQVINWNVLSGASLTISGTAELEQIKLSKGTDKSDMNKDDIEIPVITIDGPLATSVTEGETTRDLAPINVLTYGDDDAYISGTTVAANAARFVSDYADEGRDVHFVEGENKLYIGKYSCLCGANCNGSTPGCDGVKVVWTPWSSTSNNKLLPATTGNYYLTDSFTVSTQTNPVAGAQIRLDLNGQTITRYDYRLYALNATADANGNYISLYITDNSEAGTGTLKSTLKTSDSATYSGQGAVVWACNGNDITLLRGTLDASGMITSSRGAAISADNGGTFFKMYGGTVIGGTAGIGGTIGSDKGNVEIYGGTIEGGEATNGGTIYSTGSLTINGGAIINGGEATEGGTIYSTGSVTINSGTVNGGTATKGGAIYSNGTMTVESGTIQNGVADEGGNIYIAGTGQVTLLGGTVTGGKAIKATGGSGGNIYVIGDLTINGSTATVENGKAGTLDENGNVIFTVGGWGGNIYLGRIQDSEDKSVYYNGSLELISGTIGKGEAKGNGGSIYMGSSTDMTMSGGTVKNGISYTDQGGNIFCSGTLSITNGSVTNGIAKNGGNIGVNTTETVSISNCTISGGKAGVYDASTDKVTISGNGGNIRVSSTNTTCTLTISGTTSISGGKAKLGGNISIEKNTQNNANAKTTFNLQGGSITDGDAIEGGNIYISGSNTANISGGTISGGKAGVANGSGKGGNIYSAGTTTISGITSISGGQAGAAKDGDTAAKSGWGGNIYIVGGSTLTLSGSASITGGWANNNGGSVHIATGEFVMQGGSITGGTTADRGGNIFVSGQQTLTVTGGIITGGKAGSGKLGGNISANGGATADGVTNYTSISLSNVTISDGQCSKETAANMDLAALTELTLGDGVNIQGGVNLSKSDITVNLTGKVNVTGISLTTNKFTLNGLDPESTVQFTVSDASNGRIITTALAPEDMMSASALQVDGDYRLAINESNELYMTTAQIKDLPGAVINGNGIVIPLNTAVSAAAGTNQWVQLNSDLSQVNLQLTKDLNLDLNGFQLGGTITVAEGKTLYLADTNNENYTDEGGRFVGTIEGDVAQVFLTGSWEDYGHNYRFVVLKDEAEGISIYHAHRIYIAVKSVLLQPSNTAINFRTVLRCDDTLAGYFVDDQYTKGRIIGYGATAKAVTANGDNFESCAYDLEEKRLVGGGDDNLRITQLTNLLSDGSRTTWATRSTTPLYCQATITLKDSTGEFSIESAFKGNVTLKSLVQQADKATDLTPSQQDSLANMYAQYADLMADWNLENIPSMNPQQLQYHCLCGDRANTTNLCAQEGHKNLAWQPWDDTLAKEQNGQSATAATTLPKVTGNYYLTGDVTLGAQASIPSGALICIDTQNNNIESVGRVALIQEGATLHLTNSKGGSSTITGSGHNSGTGRNGATFLNQGDLCLFGGITLTTNNVNGISNGGVIESGGGLYIYGATVQAPALSTEEGVANPVYGGAVYITSGNFYMSAGEITGTEVSGNGGSVYLKAGTFTLAGGTLNCGDAFKGANVYVEAGQFDMTGGTLQGATFQPKLSGETYASYEGVNLYLKGEFNMSGGEIKDANVPGNGANIFIHSAGSATISGGTISDGKARRFIAATGSENKSDSGTQQGGNAGNIYLQGSLTISGGTISGGMAGFMNLKEDETYEIISNGYGGNILLNGSAASLVINGGTISGGKAWGNGGNIRVDGGSVTMSSGTVSQGQSLNDRGGNIWLAGSTTLEVTGGTIEKGKSKSLGGNIHTNNGGTVKLLGGTIQNGTANGSTGNVTANVSILGANSKFTLGSATISGGISINYESASSGSGFVKLTGKPAVTGNGIDLKTSGTLAPNFLIEDLDPDASVTIRDTSNTPLLVARGELDDAAWLAYEGYVKNFVAYKANYAITFEADGIYMRSLEEGTRYSCECGANRGEEAHLDGCDGYDILWNEWNLNKHSNLLPTEPGHWYLTGTLTGTGENAYYKGVKQSPVAYDYYQDAQGKYHAVTSVLAKSTAGTTMTASDGSYVSVAEYTSPSYAGIVGATAVPYAYVTGGKAYTLEEATAAGIVPVDSYEICVDLNGMKLESAETARLYSFRGAQTVGKYTNLAGEAQTLALEGWRQAKVTMNIIDSSQDHTGSMSTYGVYTKGANGQQLYRSNGTQHQGALIWLPSETIDTLNTYYIRLDASTMVAGSGALCTSSDVNLWHTTFIGGTSQGFCVATSMGVNSSIYGGGALLLTDDANVTMHGGTITGGTSIYRYMTGTNTRSYDRAMGGGNVYIASGTFIIDGGTITGGRSLIYSNGSSLEKNPELNYYSYGSGGGVYVLNGQLIVKGDANITGNTSGIVTGSIVQAADSAINLYGYVDVASLNVSNINNDNVYLGGRTLKAENFTGNVDYNTGKYITLTNDYAGSLVSRSGNCTGKLTRESSSGKAPAATGNSSTYLVGYGIASLQPTMDDLKAGVIMTNFGNDRDTSTLYGTDGYYDIVTDKDNLLGSWDTKLYATALATTDGEGDTVIVLSLDCSTFSTGTATTVKRLVSAATGVPMDNITLSSAHQHSAPPAKKVYVTNEDGTETLMTNYEYTFYKGVLEAAIAAMNDRKQATVSVGTLDTTADGKQYNFVRNVKILQNGVHVGMNTDNHITHYYHSDTDKYYTTLNESPLIGYSAYVSTAMTNVTLEYETDVDTTMQLVRYTQEGGTDIIMANFQTHPHLGSGSDSCYVHSDVVGAFRSYLAEKSGARVMYFSGGSGNVNPTTKISADNKLYSYATSTLKSSDAHVKKLERADIYGSTLAEMANNYLTGKNAYTSYNGNATKTVPMAVLINATTGSKDVKTSVREVSYLRNTSSASTTAIAKLVEQQNSALGDTPRSLIDWSTGTGDFVGGYSTNAEIWARYVGYSSNREDRIFSMFHARNIHEMLMWAEAGLTTDTIDITAYALGELGFVAAPYEMFQESGSDIKNGTANSANAAAYSGVLTNSFAMTIVATQANGGNGYIPSSLAFDNGGYSTDISNFAKGTAELLVTNYIDMLNNMK